MRRELVAANYEWINGHLKGQDVVIVGSGPSVAEVFGGEGHTTEHPNIDPARFLDIKRIVTNHAALFVKPDFLVMLDNHAAHTLALPWYSLPYRVVIGASVALQPRDNVTSIMPVQRHQPMSIDPSRGFYSSHSAGHFALSLALAMKARYIFMIGIDCNQLTRPYAGKIVPSGDNRPSHFYDAEKYKGKKIGHEPYETMADHSKFAVFKNIYNLSMNSMVDTFPKISYDEMVRMHRG